MANKGTITDRALLTLRQMNSDFESAISIMAINRDALTPFIDDVTLDALRGQAVLLALACDQLAARISAHAERSA